MKKILAPTDFSDNAMKACLYAAEIANKAKAIVYLLHVVEPMVRSKKNFLEKYFFEKLYLEHCISPRNLYWWCRIMKK